jgi:hypothetical protein
MNVGAFLPLRHRLRVDIVALGQLREALVMMLERPTHRRGRVGAPVSSLSHPAPRDGNSL